MTILRLPRQQININQVWCLERLLAFNGFIELISLKTEHAQVLEVMVIKIDQYQNI